MPIAISEVDAILPQTQCGDCGFAGCLPYARAMVNGKADINLCPPGGERGLRRLATLFNKDVSVYLADFQAKPAQVAIIDEDHCIGCTKCIKACPVDAIVGTNKQMHTIISSECTGCGLCLPPCPMDCIELTAIAARNAQQQDDLAKQARERYTYRQARLQRLTTEKQVVTKLDSNLAAKKAMIAAAVARAKQKSKPK